MKVLTRCNTQVGHSKLLGFRNGKFVTSDSIIGTYAETLDTAVVSSLVSHKQPLFLLKERDVEHFSTQLFNFYSFLSKRLGYSKSIKIACFDNDYCVKYVANVSQNSITREPFNEREPAKIFICRSITIRDFLKIDSDNC